MIGFAQMEGGITMRLIDLDQPVFVPIVDEAKGGVTYEVRMTLKEFFEKFLPEFTPMIIEVYINGKGN